MLRFATRGGIHSVRAGCACLAARLATPRASLLVVAHMRNSARQHLEARSDTQKRSRNRARFCIVSPRDATFAARADRANPIAQHTVSCAPSLGVPHMRSRALHQVEADPRIETKPYDRDLAFVRGDAPNAANTTRTPPARQCAKRVIFSAGWRAMRSTRAASAAK